MVRMTRIILKLILIGSLSGCFLIPPYSKIYDTPLWVHRQSKQEMSMDLHLKCYRESIKPFKTEKTEWGGEYIPNKEDWKKSEILYANCAYSQGYVFSASYLYCYKFSDEGYCDLLKKYRK